MRARTTSAAVGLVAAVLAGCGSGSGDSYGGSAAGSAPASSSSSAAPSSTASSSSASASASASAVGQTVEFKATDFAFSMPKTTFSPGTYTFQMMNDGKATHSFAFEGGSLNGQKSPNVKGGEVSTLTVALQPGTYVVYCPVGNHRQMGMQTTITVQ